MDTTVLIVDDEKSQRLVLAGDLKSRGFKVLEADSVDNAIELILKNTVDVILSDLKMPGASGIDLVMALKKINPEISVVIIDCICISRNCCRSNENGCLRFYYKALSP